jgi:hypothetical protein
MEKEYLKWCSFSCSGEVLFVVIGGIHNFFRKNYCFIRKNHCFIRKLEILSDFFQFKNKEPGIHTRFIYLDLLIHA